MRNLGMGLSALGNWSAIAYLFGGSLIGMFVGVIPGLSTAIILSIILVFAYHISLTGTLCLFLGAQCGSFYSASVSSILLNTPSHPEAFPITLDGYPMARNGQPGRALGLSAASTCVGGFIGCLILVGFLQIINQLPGIFHPPEYVALVTLALVLVGLLGSNSVGKAIAAAGGGLMLSSIGPSVITGTFRYTFGAVGLEGGVSLIALVLGMFAITQMVMVFGTGTASAHQDMTGKEIGAPQPVEITSGYGRQLIHGVFDAFRHWGVLLQSGIVGGLTGIIPGIGGFTGNVMAYSFARQFSRKRDDFGTGIPEGIIAPEGSSLAKEAGHIVPIIGLGIPGGISGALFISALAIKGLRTGYGFQAAYPGVTGQIVWIIALSGLIGTLAGVLIGPQLAKVTRVPGPLLVPFIFAICVSGPYFADPEFFAVMQIVIFAVVGFALRRLGFPLAAFIVGLVLGPTFETNIYLTHNIYPGLSWVTQRPMADVIFAVCFILIASKATELRRERRRQQAALAAEREGIQDESELAAVIQAQKMRLAPYPFLALCTTIIGLSVSIFFVIYGFMNYNFATGIMPEIGGLCVAIPLSFFLPRDISNYRRYRKTKASQRATPTDQPTVAAYDPASAYSQISSQSGPAMLAPDAGSVLTIDRTDDNPAPTADDDPAPEAELPPIRDKSWGRHGQYRREVIGFAWMLGLVAACWLVGFAWGSAIFMVCYGLLCTRRYFRSIYPRLLYTGLGACAIYFVTYEMFGLTHLQFSPHFQI
jgi:putative tricarboxylic transport membrane protein